MPSTFTAFAILYLLFGKFNPSIPQTMNQLVRYE